MSLLSPVFREAKALYNRFLPGCVVLCYHRVGEVVKDRWGNVVSAENFRRHIKLISENYQPISMGELVISIKSGKLPKRAVVVTFDDGYAINETYAYDTLLDQKIPAVFYISTYTLEEDVYFWWDELQAALIDNSNVPNSFSMEIFSASMTIPHSTENQRAHFFMAIHKILKGLDKDARKKILDDLAERLNFHGESNDERKPLMQAGIFAASREKIFEIGGHTHSHCALALLKTEHQAFDIKENKRILESIIGKPILHFSYPFGGEGDFNEDTIHLVKEAGFESAVTTTRKALRVGGDLYTIPRMSVKNWDEQKLKRNIENLWNKQA